MSRLDPAFALRMSELAAAVDRFARLVVDWGVSADEVGRLLELGPERAGLTVAGLAEPDEDTEARMRLLLDLDVVIRRAAPTGDVREWLRARDADLGGEVRFELLVLGRESVRRVREALENRIDGGG